jgi:uncharacterized protein with PIN domain
MNNSNYKLEPVRHDEPRLPNSEGLQEKNTYKCDRCGEIEWEGFRGRHKLTKPPCKGDWKRYYFPKF